VDNSEIKKQAANILSEPDFKQHLNPEPVFNLGDWLKQFFDFPTTPRGHIADPIPWQLLGTGLKAILLLVALFGVVLLLRWVWFKWIHREIKMELPGITQQQRKEAQEMYAHQAADALKRQDYRLAVHYLFLAAVSQVIRDSLFQGAEFMTNREIANATDFSRFKEPGRLNRLFIDMVYFDEPLWFGQDAVTEQKYHDFLRFYEQFSGLIQVGGISKRHA
jgi:hypothetical protein